MEWSISSEIRKCLMLRSLVLSQAIEFLRNFAILELIYSKDMTIKDKDLEIAIVNERLNSVSRELLISRGACTAREIFEYYLKSVHQEMMMKGSFNAKKVCTFDNDW